MSKKAKGNNTAARKTANGTQATSSKGQRIKRLTGKGKLVRDWR